MTELTAALCVPSRKKAETIPLMIRAMHGGPTATVLSSALSMPAIVEFRDVHYSAGERRIFDGLNLRIDPRRITAVMGPSGVGKTTLLRMITGQAVPDRGEVLVRGRALANLSQRELYLLRLQIGMLFQDGALFTDLDVFENVAFPLREHAELSSRLLRTLVLTKLHAVGLRGAARLMPAELSGGMARRVALARAVALDPPILLCDEPFTGLDPISAGVVVRLLGQLTDALGSTLVVVSHDIAEVERLADCSCILANGKVAASGSPRELRTSASEVVNQFLTGSPDGPVPFHYAAPDYFSQLLQWSRT